MNCPGGQRNVHVSFTDRSSLSHGTRCTGEEMQRAARTTTQHQRPRPGRRRLSMHHLPLNLTKIFLFTTMILSLLCMPTAAAEYPVSQSRAVKGQLVDGRIMFERNPVPQPVLHRRDNPASTDTASTTRAVEPPEASNSDSSTAAPSLPRAFDGGFGTNYSQPSCPTFLRSMVNNDTFISCVPFSLLLQNSMSFFDASRSLSTINAVLNASCSVFFPTCSTLMSSFAQTLRSSTACQDDYNNENPQVRQAYAGLLAYDVSYNASCLKNTPTPGNPNRQQNNRNYCFANAITNRTSPTDSYVYYLPLGIPLPAGSLPTCDSCLTDTMAVYANAASNKSQPLNLDYVDAAAMVNRMCGPAFVNESIPNAASSSGRGKTSSSAASRGRSLDAAWLGLLVGAAGLVAAS